MITSKGKKMEQKRILLVDDEQDILTSVKMFLETQGYYVETTDNGKDALDILKKEKFDLVLLDMLMPQMSGKEVLERMRADKKLKAQKVAFMTVVSLSTAGKKMIEELKPVDYIEKPIDASKLKKRIAEILN